MSAPNLTYNLKTLDWFTSENLALFRPIDGSKRKKVYFFGLALLELMYDPEEDQHWIVAIDLSLPMSQSRKWPMLDMMEWAGLRQPKGVS